MSSSDVTYEVEVYAVNGHSGESFLVFRQVYDFPLEWSYSRCSDSIRSSLRELGFVCDVFFVINPIYPF